MGPAGIYARLRNRSSSHFVPLCNFYPRIEKFIFFIKRLNKNSEDKRAINALNIEKDTGKVFVADSIDFESMKVRIETTQILT